MARALAKQTLISTGQFTVDAAGLTGHLVAGMVSDQVLGSGFTSLTFTALVSGVNNTPIVAGGQSFFVFEDSASFAINPLLKVTGADTLDVLTVDPAVLPAGVRQTAGANSFDPNDAAFQRLSAGEVTTITWSYAVPDGHVLVPATATFVVTGVNDAPVVSGPVNGGTILRSAAPVSRNLLANITNFHVGVDLLDFTGLGSSFGSLVTLTASASTIGGNSIGWQSSGGSSFVYVTSSANTLTLANAAMKIELLGPVSLTNNNIVHP